MYQIPDKVTHVVCRIDVDGRAAHLQWVIGAEAAASKVAWLQATAREEDGFTYAAFPRSSYPEHYGVPVQPPPANGKLRPGRNSHLFRPPQKRARRANIPKHADAFADTAMGEPGGDWSEVD